MAGILNNLDPAKLLGAALPGAAQIGASLLPPPFGQIANFLVGLGTQAVQGQFDKAKPTTSNLVPRQEEVTQLTLDPFSEFNSRMA